MKKIWIRIVLILSLCVTLALGTAAGNTEGAKEAILQGLENREEEIRLSAYGLGKDEVWALFRQVVSENPRLYYVLYSGTIQYSGNTVTSLFAEYMENMGAAEDAAYEAAVQEALQCVLPGMSDEQKALVLHDWLILQNAYDYENYKNSTIPDASYSAYGAMVLKTAVCEGYTRAYADLLLRCGIPCVIVKSSAMNHTWNQVCIDGNWYHVDVTWDDPAPDLPGTVYHMCFLKSDTAIQDSTVDSPHYGWSGGYACTDTRYDNGAYWSEGNSAVCFTDANTLWRLQTEGKYLEQTISLVSRSVKTGKETIAVSAQDYWPVWGTSKHWLDSYSGLALLDGYLYFNDSLRVYRYDPDTGGKTTVLTLSGKEGNLYGLYVENGGLYYRVSTSPEESGKAVLLKTEKKTDGSPFLDIEKGSYFLNAASWALKNGVTTGTGTDAASGKVIFSPDATCTRGQVVTFLWRAMDEPEPKTLSNPFLDVKETDYYYKAVLWAVEQGITNGMERGGQICFCPDDTCTYAHILTFLWRCVAGMESSGGQWFDAPVAWAKENGLLGGVNISDAPDQCECPRKAVVLFLYRCAA